ncbi:hypothetical protein YC2023_017426 [Brassica napus]
MEIEVSSSTHDTVDLDSIRVKRKTLQNLLDDCHRAPDLLNLADTAPSGDRTEIGGSGKDYSNPGTCFKQSLNLPNLKLWITGSLLNQEARSHSLWRQTRLLLELDAAPSLKRQEEAKRTEALQNDDAWVGSFQSFMSD